MRTPSVRTPSVGVNPSIGARGNIQTPGAIRGNVRSSADAAARARLPGVNANAGGNVRADAAVRSALRPTIDGRIDGNAGANVNSRTGVGAGRIGSDARLSGRVDGRANESGVRDFLQLEGGQGANVRANANVRGDANVRANAARVQGRLGADAGVGARPSWFDGRTARLADVRANLSAAAAAAVAEANVRGDARVDGRADLGADRIDGRVDGRIDGRVGGRLDGRVDGRIDGRVDGRIDGNHFVNPRRGAYWNDWSVGIRNHWHPRGYHGYFNNRFWATHSVFHPWARHHYWWGGRYPYSYWWGRPAWGGVVGWFPGWGWNAPIFYGYGRGGNVVYSNGWVYMNDQPIATYADYAYSAAELAEVPIPENPDAATEWLPLGTFALSTGPEDKDPTRVLQLVVDQDGIISGTMYDEATDQTVAVQGRVDKDTQRVAFTMGDNPNVVYESGIYNLTQDETPLLVHKGDETDIYMLVRLDPPEDAAAGAAAAASADAPLPLPMP